MSSKDIQVGLEMNESVKDGFQDMEYDPDLPRIVMNSTDKKVVSPRDSDALNFTIKVCKNWRIRIYKPLIPLKLVLFFWFGGGSFVAPFLTVYFKQRGITLSELSTFFILSPICQFMGTILSGVAADKIGRSKPVLVANLVLAIVFLSGILFIPRLNVPSCASQPINLKCHPQQFDRLITKTSCDVVEDIIEVNSCDVQCPENVTEHCDGQNLICEILAGSEMQRNFSLSIHVKGSYKARDRCYYNVSSMYHENATYSWCNVPHKMNCRVSCIVDSGVNCIDEGDNRDALLITTMALFILFQTAYSNCYRFMDVTSMALVKEHNSDFGHERFFSICGILVVSPIAGYLVDATTPKGMEKNYLAAFYLFMVTVLIILVVVYKLEVRINPPGKKMWRKATYLLKNPDVLSFTLVIFVLGTAFCFTKNFMFWYLEGMNTPSFLIGLIPAVSALYGLPFLLTSRWWVNKIGATQIFILGLLGYVVNSIGYSFLKDPWYALILEAMNIFTYHLLWVAVVLHSHELAPEGLTATVISTAGSIHYHIGKASGSSIGGFVMDAFNGRVAFRVMGIICLISAVLYAFYLYIRRTCFSRVLPGNEAGPITDGQSNNVSTNRTSR
ncbi:major facilitator superfamily domain-containing protein 6-like isoform X1 [Argiope bruennichi]|uniref:major facilitator superfamily domain-containing protein 6-like isoform X1 n=1 Tax=Argiope bruennichi TaxID=94029 RepID=UPI00249527EB|nr:major facilitator superfamily domain-containing protein 6-like isoform X1 [Argiope bruennichi]XP_055936334.1 major facilitator superfamily domain-containing protein 6-like isoform X1 [Argiope bruennichi]XP_055936335.1 major facilitator superfamily domain-containing protein 6-like isoform X1 [Argiope bruennichi]